MDLFGFKAAKDLLKLQLENPAAATKLIAKKSLITGAINLAAATAFFAVTTRIQDRRMPEILNESSDETDE